MHLLEREKQLAALAKALVQSGRVVLVSGEAGIGKTTLIRQFREDHHQQAVFLWGMCDDLYTPQALAPFYDIAFQLGGDLKDLLPTATNLNMLGHTLLGELQARLQPTVIVIEDIHWADEATLDLILFLSRRIEALPVMFVLTLREGQTLQNRKLRTLLGSLPTGITERITLTPLSLEAVRQLSGPGDDHNVEAVYQMSHGNPFYATELLAAQDGDSLPRTVRDAVLARVSRLSAGARHALDAVSIVPNHAEEWLIREVVDLTNEHLTELLGSGILTLQGGFFTFRHELARRAVAEALLLPEARALHRAIFDALQAHDSIPLARLVHHAALGDLGEAVVELAPLAAHQASAVNAHQEAAAHYATALRYTHLLSTETEADLLEARAEACYLGVTWEIALPIYEQALTLRQQLGQAERVGDNLRVMSRLAWGFARIQQARRYALEAIRILRRRPPGRSLALAYSVLGQWHMHQCNVRRTLYWSSKAVSLAEAVHEREPYVDALTNIATILTKGPDVETGIARLEESLHLALEHDLLDQTARTYFNLCTALLEQHSLDHAYQVAHEALRYTDDRSMNSYYGGMVTLKALIAFCRGDWAEARHLAQRVIDTFPISDSRGIAPLMCKAILARLAARQSAPDVDERIEDLQPKTHSQPPLPDDAAHIYLPRAEAAWLRGDSAACAAEAQTMLDLLKGRVFGWAESWALFWLWRCGYDVPLSSVLLKPHRMQISGDWQAAASYWERRDYPYERAMSLADGDENALLEAFSILDRLGAQAAVDYVRKRMREAGVDSVPRGMNTATRQNPAGLTRRQMDVLALLRQHLTNAEIAARLHISPKTVEHHVSAILAKLEVSNREEAIRVSDSLSDEI